MRTNRALLILFFASVLLIPIFYILSPIFSGLLAIIAVLILIIGLITFKSGHEKKKSGSLEMHFIKSFRHYMIKAYIKPKNLWIIFDKDDKKFRPADFRDTPINVAVFGLFGIILLYLSYLFLLAVPHSYNFFWFRIFAIVAFGIVGFYNLFISTERLVSLSNKKSEKLSQKLNKMKTLLNFASSDHGNVEITPNFVLPNGFITSIEVLSKKQMERKMEQIVIDISDNIKML